MFYFYFENVKCIQLFLPTMLSIVLFSSLYLLGIASTSLYGRTIVTWKILAGPIYSDCSFYSESKDASISVSVGFVTEGIAFFKDSKSSIMRINSGLKKSLGLCDLTAIPLSQKFSKCTCFILTIYLFFN